MKSLPIMLTVALLSSAGVPSGDLFAANKAACAAAKTPSSHVGQVLGFRAEFRSDFAIVPGFALLDARIGSLSTT